MSLYIDPLVKDFSFIIDSGLLLMCDKANGTIYDPFRKCWMLYEKKLRAITRKQIISLKLITRNAIRRHYIETYKEFEAESKEIELIDSDYNKSLYQLKFENFPVDMNYKTFKAQIPVLLTDDIIMAALRCSEQLTKPGVVIDIDYARVLISAVTIRYTYKKYNYARINRSLFGENIFNTGWVQIKWDDLKTLGSLKFPQYMQALIDADIVQCDGLHWHFEGAEAGFNKARCYKINDKFYTGTERLHYYVPYENYEIRYRVLNYKYNLRKRFNLVDSQGNDMIRDVETIFNQIDEHKIFAFYKDNLYAFYDVTTEEELQAKLNDPKVIKLAEFIEHISLVKENSDFYYNVCDEFGGRFHSVMTNTSSKIRQFIHHNNVDYVQADIKNSQMVILSTLISNPEVVKELLSQTRPITIDDKVVPVFEYYKKQVKTFDINNMELEQFCRDAREGVMYDKMAHSTAKPRNAAKLDAMKIIFSTGSQYKKLKKTYSSLYPELIKMCGSLNTEQISLIPKITQQVESELFINRIVREFFGKKKHPAITIHDSILMHPDDVNAFNECYTNTFKRLGIEPFLLKYSSLQETA